MTARGLTALLRYDRAAVLLFGVACAVVMAWAYLLCGAGVEVGMPGMGGRMLQMGPAWTPEYAARIFCMWTVMMVAMMTPSAFPSLFLVAAGADGRLGQSGGGGRVISFTAGYLAVWAGFSAVATLLQWAFDRGAVLSLAMASRNVTVTGLILLAAGLYQLTPVKEACLRRCRLPLRPRATDPRGRVWGMAAAGMRHGLCSLACCGGLMGLLFVGGVMNLAWMAGLALLVLVERMLSWGGSVGRMAGAALTVWGVMTLAGVAL